MCGAILPDAFAWASSDGRTPQRQVSDRAGKHSLSAELMVALVLKSVPTKYLTVIETTDTVCQLWIEAQGHAGTAASQRFHRRSGCGGPSRAASPRQATRPLAQNPKADDTGPLQVRACADRIPRHS